MNEDDGIEMHVRKCIEINDVSWFPTNISHHSITEHAGNHAKMKSNRELLGNHDNEENSDKKSAVGKHGNNDKGGLMQGDYNSDSVDQGIDKHHGQIPKSNNALLMEKLVAIQEQMQGLLVLKTDQTATATATATPGSYMHPDEFYNKIENETSYKIAKVMEASNANAQYIHDSMNEFGSSLNKITKRIERLQRKFDEKEKREKYMTHPDKSFANSFEPSMLVDNDSFYHGGIIEQRGNAYSEMAWLANQTVTSSKKPSGRSASANKAASPSRGNSNNSATNNFNANKLTSSIVGPNISAIPMLSDGASRSNQIASSVVTKTEQTNAKTHKNISSRDINPIAGNVSNPFEGNNNGNRTLAASAIAPTSSKPVVSSNSIAVGSVAQSQHVVSSNVVASNAQSQFAVSNNISSVTSQIQPAASQTSTVPHHHRPSSYMQQDDIEDSGEDDEGNDDAFD